MRQRLSCQQRRFLQREKSQGHCLSERKKFSLSLRNIVLHKCSATASSQLVVGLGLQNTLIRKCSSTENETFHCQRQVVETPLSVTSSRNDKSSCDHCHGMLRRTTLQTGAVCDIYATDFTEKTTTSSTNKISSQPLKCGNTSSNGAKSSWSAVTRCSRRCKRHDTNDT